MKFLALFSLFFMLLYRPGFAAGNQNLLLIAECETPKGSGNPTKMEILVRLGRDGSQELKGMLRYDVGLPHRPESETRIETKSSGKDAIRSELKIFASVPSFPEIPYMSFVLPAERSAWTRAVDSQGTAVELFCRRF